MFFHGYVLKLVMFVRLFNIGHDQYLKMHHNFYNIKVSKFAVPQFSTYRGRGGGRGD